MAILVGFALTLFCLAIVIYPLVVARSRSRVVPLEEDLSPDEIELESIKDSVQTLRFDYDLGKINEEYYREQLQSYRLTGANALRRQVEAGLRTKEAELEREVLEAKAVLDAEQQETRSGKEIAVEILEPTDDQPGP